MEGRFKFDCFVARPLLYVPNAKAQTNERLANRYITRTWWGQILLSKKAINCDLVNAPTFVASKAPSLKSINVGMPRTANF